MLIEQVTCGALAHEDGTRVAVVEYGDGVVQHAPARHHVIFVAIMFDVWDVARGAVREADARIIEVRGGGAKGVDLL